MATIDPERERDTALTLFTLSRRHRVELTQLAIEVGSIAAVAERAGVKVKTHYVRDIIAACDAHSIQVLSLTDSRYPNPLRMVPDPPPAIFVRSNADIGPLPTSLIAVVGARSASIDTCQRTTVLAHEIAAAGMTVVSGLAIGVDGAAHRGALRAPLVPPTIAVLAHGLDTLYPTSHEPLATAIIERGGILLSEYPPGTTAQKHHFLERNRIIAGLSLGVVVIEASERSGSLVTAQNAADYGRDVFVYTDAASDTALAGSAKLLDDGAIRVTSARDVLAEYGIECGERGEGKWITLSPADMAARPWLSPLDLIELELAGDLFRLEGDRILLRERP